MWETLTPISWEGRVIKKYSIQKRDQEISLKVFKDKNFGVKSFCVCDLNTRSRQ